MSYLESAEGEIITKKRALKELTDHGCIESHDFFNELGHHDYYEAQAVLRFLGY